MFREEPSKVIFSITAILANQTTVYAGASAANGWPRSLVFPCSHSSPTLATDPKQLTTFHADYEAEHGYPWYNVYPREPMVHDLIYPEYLGEKVGSIGAVVLLSPPHSHPYPYPYPTPRSSPNQRLVHLSPAHYTNRSGLAR